MSENIQVDTINAPDQTPSEAVTPQENEQVVSNPYEEQAREMGWRPKSEFRGDPDDFVSAKEFIKRKSFFDRINSQTKKIQEQEEQMRVLMEHNMKTEQWARKALEKELQQKKKQALLDGDADAVLEVDDALIELKVKNAAEEAKPAKEEPRQIPPELLAWKNANSWYDTNQEMRDYADFIAERYIKREGIKDPTIVLPYITSAVKKQFAEHFKSQMKTPSVEPSSGSRVSAGSRAPVVQATEQEMAIARKMSKHHPTVYKTPDDYIKAIRDLEKRGG